MHRTILLLVVFVLVGAAGCAQADPGTLETKPRAAYSPFAIAEITVSCADEKCNCSFKEPEQKSKPIDIDGPGVSKGLPKEVLWVLSEQEGYRLEIEKTGGMGDFSSNTLSGGPSGVARTGPATKAGMWVYGIQVWKGDTLVCPTVDPEICIRNSAGKCPI